MGHVARTGHRTGAYRFSVGRSEGKNNLEDLTADGRILKRLFTEDYGLGGGMDWIDLSQNMDRWRVLVNAIMNVRVP